MPATAPYIDAPLTNGGLIQVSVSSVAYVRQDPANAGRCYFGTYSQEPTEPWHVAMSADAMTAALAAAGGGGGGGGATDPGRVLFAGVVLGNGTLAGGYQAPGVSFTVGPYTPGSGQYSFSLNGIGPVSMVIQATQIQGPALPIVLGAVQINPQQLEVWGTDVTPAPWGDYAFYLLVVRAG